MKVFIFSIAVILYILIGTGFYYNGKSWGREYTSQEIIYIVLFWPIEFFALIAITIKILINKKRQ